MKTLRGELIELCRDVGLEVHGNMVYGTVDTIAVLVELLMYEDEQECSEALKLSVLAKSIAETPFCASSTKTVDAGKKL